MDDDAVAAACRRELELLHPTVRRDPARLEDLLHEDFVEVGASGRRWNRAEIIAALLGEEDGGTVDAHHLEGRRLAVDVVLVTYRTRSAQGEAWRSSIWVPGPSGWQVVFHQGTPVGIG